MRSVASEREAGAWVCVGAVLKLVGGGKGGGEGREGSAKRRAYRKAKSHMQIENK